MLHLNLDYLCHLTGKPKATTTYKTYKANTLALFFFFFRINNSPFQLFRSLWTFCTWDFTLSVFLRCWTRNSECMAASSALVNHKQLPATAGNSERAVKFNPLMLQLRSHQGPPPSARYQAETKCPLYPCPHSSCNTSLLRISLCPLLQPSTGRSPTHLCSKFAAYIFWLIMHNDVPKHHLSLP